MKYDLEALRRAKEKAEEGRRNSAEEYKKALASYNNILQEGKALVQTAKEKLQADKKGLEEAQKSLNECTERLAKAESAQKEAEGSVKLLQEDLKVAKQYLEMDRAKLSRALAAVDWSKVKADEDRAAYARACREAEACRENVRKREGIVADLEKKIGGETTRWQKLVAAVTGAKKEKEQLASKCEKAKMALQVSEKARDTVCDEVKKIETVAKETVEKAKQLKEGAEAEFKEKEEDLRRAMGMLRDY